MEKRRNRDNVDPEEESRRKLGGIWPHSMSPMFALLAATLGLFNISRFAVLSIEYGGNLKGPALLIRSFTAIHHVRCVCVNAECING